jgi:hypothetical protein
MYAPPSLSPTLVHPPTLTSRANARLSQESSPVTTDQGICRLRIRMVVLSKTQASGRYVIDWHVNDYLDSASVVDGFGRN